MVTLLKNPIQTIKILFLIGIEFILNLIKTQKLLISMIFLILIFYFGIFYEIINLENNLKLIFNEYNSILLFCLYWILLGVASSIGLGTGLHTFVLYLGPRTAKFVLAAYECKSIPLYTNGRFSFNSNLQCGIEELTFWNILKSVELEALLWGFGTALGELPPYIVAKNATLKNQNNKELEDMIKYDKSLINKLQRFIFKYIQKYAFISILVLSSIPNPLFDLVGLTCGHFLVPFHIFLIGTIIGKAINKANIQMIFIIILFSENTLNLIIKNLTNIFPNYADFIIEFINNQKKNLLNSKVNDSKPLIGHIWDFIVFGMIFYFINSLINGLTREYLENQRKVKIN